ncbi:MAG TPA: DNA replication and repair protein RecF [Chitinophagaceae bacterium]|nr:DNA replication and repair protein RecF [Chitinophagaceae bacterium]
MLLSSISLLHFKNYPQAAFAFSSRIVGICGSNGMGKTNLLDAIHYLCFTKSYFSKTDAQHVLHGAQGFRIAGQFLLEDSQTPGAGGVEVICILRENNKKEFFFDGVAYDKFAAHIGRLPCVFIAPDDVQMITGSSEERRRFTDALLCQLDAVYLQQLISYNKVLAQRNSYLKSLYNGAAADPGLLDVYDQQLLQHGNYVFEQRSIFLRRLLPLVQSFYFSIAGAREDVGIAYETALHQPFAQLLQQARQRDVQLQRTTQGIHRDDLLLTLGDQPFKSIASQGQRKSLLFAMKLAEFELLKENKGFAPFLLLDDVFEKLDEQRMHNLLTWVCVQNSGQVFITDTHRERLASALSQLQQPMQIIELQ